MFKLYQPHYTKTLDEYKNLEQTLIDEKEKQISIISQVQGRWKGQAAETYTALYQEFLTKGEYFRAQFINSREIEIMDGELGNINRLMARCEQLGRQLQQDEYVAPVLPADGDDTIYNDGYLTMDYDYIPYVNAAIDNALQSADEGRDILLEAAEICSEVMDMSEYTSMIHKADRKIHRLENYRRAFNEYADGVQELENRMSSRFQALKNEYEEMKDGKWEQIADMLIDRRTDISEIFHNDRVVKADDSKDLNSWYERIQKQDEQIKKAKEKFVKVVDVIYLEPDNPAYVLECDWGAVDEFLWRNPDDISDTEYLAFVDMLSEMDTLTMNELFGEHAYHLSRVSDNCIYSPVLRRATDIYLQTAVMEAELTIFQKDSEFDFDKKKVTDNLTKAVMLKQVMDEIGQESRVKIAETSENGYLSYEIIVYDTIEIYLDNGTFGMNDNNVPSTIDFVTQKKVRVHSYAEDPDQSIDEAVKDVMISFGGNIDMKEMCVTIAINNIRDYAITQTLNMSAGGFVGKWSIPGTLYTVMMSTMQTIENTNAATAGIKALEKGNQLVALCIQANVVTVSGVHNEVILFNSHYNLEELAIRVGAYNTMHKKETIKVDDLIASLENGDLTLVEKFTEWYFDVGKNDCIEEYKSNLQSMLTEYEKQNKIVATKTLHELSYVQIQELIRKMDDLDYEKDKELWGIQ